jgi:hypothetical protein
MKTTIDIPTELYEQARGAAKRSGRPIRAFIEEGLRLALEAERAKSRYKLPDRSVGNSVDPDPLESLNWVELRDLIYGGR